MLNLRTPKSASIHVFKKAAWHTRHRMEYFNLHRPVENSIARINFKLRTKSSRKPPFPNPRSPSKKIKDETARRPKRNTFPFLISGRDGLNFPCIMSKGAYHFKGLGPVSRKSRKLFGPEKSFVKLRPAYSVKLVFSYVVKGINIKITAKLRASRRLCFEDTKRITVVHPKCARKILGLSRLARWIHRWNGLVLPNWELLLNKLLIIPEQGQFGNKQLSGRQHRCCAFANWLIGPASSDKWQAPRDCISAVLPFVTLFLTISTRSCDAARQNRQSSPPFALR